MINLRFEFCKPTRESGDIHLPIVKHTKFGNLIDVPICRMSQIAEHMIANTDVTFEPFDTDLDKPYIFSTALCYGPTDWTNWGATHEYDENKKSVFEYLPEKLLNDLRNKKALLLLDQSVEGYHMPWLWDWFHKKCIQYNISPQCVIYATGAQSAIDDYEDWIHRETYTGERIVVVPATSLFYYVKRHCFKYKVSITFEEMLEHKRANTPKYLYDCFMLRPRSHRIVNYLHLFNAGLLKDGNIGMSKIEDWNNHLDVTHMDALETFKLPRDIIDHISKINTEQKIEHTNNQDNLNYSDYAERILTTMYKNSWITQVVETTFYNNEAVFISEKSIKPIAYMQPFVTVGSRHTLKYLRKLGYKTFHPIIDESYDEEEDSGERLKMIMAELNKIKSNPNKLAWLESLRPMIEHNYNLFHSTQYINSYEYQIINNHYTNYFKENNVS